MSEPEIRMEQTQEGVNVDDLRQDIEDQYQELCHKAQLGGAPTLDELADVVSNMCKIMEVLDVLMVSVFKLQDKKS